MNQPCIGIIDSGVGGLTVAKEVMRQLPRERICYLGDTDRCPYGSRSLAEVYRFSLQMVDFMLQQPLKALLVACNTATAVALKAIRSRCHLPVIGVVEPGVRAALRVTTDGQIAVIGTEVTIASGVYERTLQSLHPEVRVHSLACPALVPLVEQGIGAGDNTRIDSIVRGSLQLLPVDEIDTLILGCTHYPLLGPWIERAIPNEVVIINSAQETAEELSTILSYNHLLATSRNSPDHSFFTSGDPDHFQVLAERFLGRHVGVDRVVL